MFRSRSLILALLGLLLSACGTTPKERGVSGAGIGAGVGAVLGAVTGLTVLQGALIGAGVGGVAGAVTDEEDFSLGEPIWASWPGAKGDGPQDLVAKTSGSGMVARTQVNLTRLGYEPGPADGLLGENTHAAISEYQRDRELPVDGKLSEELALQIHDEAKRQD